jgi:DNA-directed RNA polymerase subunit K/omega
MNLTKYELARILGARALQLFYGAPPLVEVQATDSFLDVAERELKRGVLPLSVVRKHDRR